MAQVEDWTTSMMAVVSIGGPVMSEFLALEGLGHPTFRFVYFLSPYHRYIIHHPWDCLGGRSVIDPDPVYFICFSCHVILPV